MIKYLLLLILISFSTSCNLISPQVLTIKNKSAYKIKVDFDRGSKTKLIILKNKGDFNLVYPGSINFTITTLDTKLKKHYTTEILYQEDKEIEFFVE